MATQTNVTQAIDRQLDNLADEITNVREIAEYWDDLAEPGQAAIEIAWDVRMFELGRLADAFGSGRMTPGQRVRYRELLHQIQEVLPIVERLDLSRPPVPLDG